MKKVLPKTIPLKNLSRDFTPEQFKIAEAEMKYYELLTSFKEAREKQGLSQDELAKKAHVNRTTLSKIESGLRNATINTLSKLAAAMNMRLDVSLRSY